MSAKDIIVRPISAQEASAVVREVHYSGKVVNNSTLHLGVFYAGKLEGAMQFGSPLDRRKVLPLVEGTLWNQMLELNRMAFGEALPRNSESRALAVAFRMLRKHRLDIKWILSFADGTQCGDGTIYRASGFLLTGLKENNQIWQAPSGESFSRTSLTDGRSKQQQQQQARQVASRTTLTKGAHIRDTGASSMRQFVDAGWKPLTGYQFRYIKFLDPTWVDRLTVPVIPFDQIPPEARMYRGQRIASAAASSEDGGHPPPQDGATPIRPLQGATHG